MSLNFLKQNSPQSKIRQQKLPHQVLPPIVPLGPIPIHPLGHIKCQPPPQPAPCHRRHNSPPLPGHHFLHCRCCPSPPQLLPVRLCQSLPPQPYALDVSNRVREGLVIASRRRRPTRGPSRGLASSSSSSSPLPSTSDHCDGHYDMIIAGGGAVGSALARMLLDDTTAASPGGGGLLA